MDIVTTIQAKFVCAAGASRSCSRSASRTHFFSLQQRQIIKSTSLICVDFYGLVQVYADWSPTIHPTSKSTKRALFSYSDDKCIYQEVATHKSCTQTLIQILISASIKTSFSVRYIIRNLDTYFQYHHTVQKACWFPKQAILDMPPGSQHLVQPLANTTMDWHSIHLTMSSMGFQGDILN